MDRKLNKIILAGLLSVGACHCHAQSEAQGGWGWGKTPAATPVADDGPVALDGGAVDWRKVPASQAAKPYILPTAQSRSSNNTFSFPVQSQELTSGKAGHARQIWGQLPVHSPTEVMPRSVSSVDYSPQNKVSQTPAETFSWEQGRYLRDTRLQNNRQFGPMDAIAPWSAIPSESIPSTSENIAVQGVQIAPNNQSNAAEPSRVLPKVASSVREGIIGPADELPHAQHVQPHWPSDTAPNSEAVSNNTSEANNSGVQREQVQKSDKQYYATQSSAVEETLAFGLIESYEIATAELPAPFSLPPVEQVVLSPDRYNADSADIPVQTALEITPAESGQSQPANANVPTGYIASGNLAGASGTLPTSLIPLQPMVSITSPSDRMAVEDTSDNAATEANHYVLQNLRGGDAEPMLTATVVPIDVLPMNRLIVAPQLSAKEKLTTAQMTGPLTDPAILFSKLNIENDFRQLPSSPTTDVRNDVLGVGPDWGAHAYAWVTPTFYHRPLYFEQENLERYGIGSSRYSQPIHSAAHFFFSIGLMPYKLTTQHPCENVYTLGHNRPGDCVPFQRRSLLGQSYPFEACRYFDSYSAYR